MSDLLTTVPVDNPQAGLEWWDLIEPYRRTGRFRSQLSGEECTFSAKDGRPYGRDADRFRGYRLRTVARLELREAIEEAKQSNPSRNDIAQRITDHLVDRCPFGEHWQAYTEVSIRYGSNRLRVDVGYLGPRIKTSEWGERQTAGLEVKSSEADMSADSKWPVYTDRFHRFAFAAPEGVIQPSQLPSRIGLYEWTGEALRCVREPVALDSLPIEIAYDTAIGFALSNRGGDR